MTATKANKISFEDAMQKLEHLVVGMEAGDIPLSELVDQYEEGSQLLSYCAEELKKASIRIEKVVDLDGGQILLEPFIEDESYAN